MSISVSKIVNLSQAALKFLVRDELEDEPVQGIYIFLFHTGVKSTEKSNSLRRYYCAFHRRKGNIEEMLCTVARCVLEFGAFFNSNFSWMCTIAIIN
jgi:hypothetical protein